MIDWHSHILPSMDDGSRDVYESVAMLNELRQQGIKYVVATPHFLADGESVDAFLERRDDALKALSAKLSSAHPEIICGAEVKYYPGISRMQGLSRLAIDGTKLILIEMPTSKWTGYAVRELEELSLSSGLTVVLAHVERYLFMQTKETTSRLTSSGILMQTNASFCDGFLKRRKVLRLISEEKIQLIGSDCHNMSSRPPRISRAYAFLQRKLSPEIFLGFNRFGCDLLGKE